MENTYIVTSLIVLGVITIITGISYEIKLIRTINKNKKLIKKNNEKI